MSELFCVKNSITSIFFSKYWLTWFFRVLHCVLLRNIFFRTVKISFLFNERHPVIIFAQLGCLSDCENKIFLNRFLLFCCYPFTTVICAVELSYLFRNSFGKCLVGLKLVSILWRCLATILVRGELEFISIISRTILLSAR